MKLRTREVRPAKKVRDWWRPEEVEWFRMAIEEFGITSQQGLADFVNSFISDPGRKKTRFQTGSRLQKYRYHKRRGTKIGQGGSEFRKLMMCEEVLSSSEILSWSGEPLEVLGCE